MTPARNGEVTLNWIAELAQPNGAPPREDWNRAVDCSRFARDFAGWRFPWLDVPDVIASTA
jgi:hypothetical protein